MDYVLLQEGSCILSFKSLTLNIKALRSFKTAVNCFQPTQHNMPEDLHLQQHRSENHETWEDFFWRAFSFRSSRGTIVFCPISHLLLMGRPQ